MGDRLLEKRPFSSYNELYETVMTKGSGLSTRVLQALNAIGGAAFEDNPRTGNERENFFEYLNIPAFETKDVPPKVKAQMRTLDEFSDSESFVTPAVVARVQHAAQLAVDAVHAHLQRVLRAPMKHDDQWGGGTRLPGWDVQLVQTLPRRVGVGEVEKPARRHRRGVGLR